MSAPLRSANTLVDMVRATPDLLNPARVDALDTLQKLADTATKNLPPPALVGDQVTYRIVVGSLGAVAIIATLGAIYLSVTMVGSTNAEIPDVLTALGAAAIGALAGLLAPSPAGR